MIVLGIDPGFTVTGYSIMTTVKGTDMILDAGYVSFPSSEDLPHRIKAFYDFFNEKIKMHHVTIISLETPFLGKNVQSFLKLGYLRGIVHLLCAQHTLQIREFSPREVKQSVTGFGGAQKDQVARVLQMLFPNLIQAKKTDVTDAIAIGLCGLWYTKLNLR